MGLRFRKTVSLGKGVRLNFSKSGVSTSVGPRGASVTFGKNGTYANVGLPGTGLSYRKRLDVPNRSKAGSGEKSSNAHNKINKEIAFYTGNENFNFRFEVNSKGQTVFYDSNGNEITDLKLIALLKKHPSFIEKKEEINNEMRACQENNAKALYQETEAFLNIYQLSPRIRTKQNFEEALIKLKPRQYNSAPFAKPMPTTESVAAELAEEAAENVNIPILFGKKKAIDRYVNESLSRELAAQVADWNACKQQYEFSIQAERLEFERKAEKHHKKKLKRIKAALDGNPSYIDWAVEKKLSSFELPFEITANYDYDTMAHKLSIDLDLPEIDNLPKTHAVQLSSGNYKEKEKSQKQLKEEYVQCVLGLVVFVTAHLFNISPVIKQIVVSGFTTRRDTRGLLSNDYIVSVLFTREKFQALKPVEQNPLDTILSFENRMNITSSSIMKTIEPL